MADSTKNARVQIIEKQEKTLDREWKKESTETLQEVGTITHVVAADEEDPRRA